MEEKEIVLKLYQNLDMGVIGIQSIEDKIESRDLSKIILSQKQEYEKLKEEMIPLCKQYGVENKELGSFVKMNSDIMANMKTLMDHSDSHIAKMMMEGTNKGLLQLEEIKNNLNETNEKLSKMLEEILLFEKNNYEELKVFL